MNSIERRDITNVGTFAVPRMAFIVFDPTHPPSSRADLPHPAPAAVGI